MRMTRQTLPTVLALAFVALLVTPIIATASSGLPATVTMNPSVAGPGSIVEVTGIDFPDDHVVTIELGTIAGSVDVAVVKTAEGGYFRELVTLPAEVAPGSWELRATAIDGASASHEFQAVAGVLADASAPLPVAEAGLTSSSNSGTDIMVMLVLAVLLAALGGGAAYAWREAHADGQQAGMGTGDDPIWAGAGGGGTTLELTASDDPDWSPGQGES